MSQRKPKREYGFLECTWPKSDCPYDAADYSDYCYFHDKVDLGYIDGTTTPNASNSLPRLLREWDIGLTGINLDE